MKKIRYIYLIIFILVFFSSCNNGDENTEKSKRITSANGNIKITVPFDWNEKDLGEKKALIQAGGIANDKFLMIIQAKKEDFDVGLSLAKFDEAMLKIYKENSKDFNIRETKKEKLLAEKSNAYILFNVAKDKNIITQLVTVEAESNFYQIILWSNESKYKEYESEFLEIAKSFKSKY